MILELTDQQAEILYGVLAYGRIDVDRTFEPVENNLHAMIESIKHTEKCKYERASEAKARAAYEKNWPNYCRKCGGEGGHSDYEYRGECHGFPASEYVFNYCPACVEQLVCPRCGASKNNNFELDVVIDGQDPLHCTSCGWNEGDPGAPEVLNPYDCGCGEPSIEPARELIYD